MPECVAQGCVFFVTETSIPLAVCKTGKAVNGIIRSHPVPHGIGENTPEEPYSAAGSPFATSYPRQPAFFGRLALPGRFAQSDIVHERIHVFARDGGNLHMAEKGLDVSLDAALIDLQCA